MRGTQHHDAARPAVRRFIPACAGNALTCAARSRGNAVHPRVCGERADGAHAVAVHHGSSPRVRGTLSWFVRISASLRFIPACAGNAVDRTSFSSRASVHPRVCGERVLLRDIAVAAAGSSPRVRGTPCFEVRLMIAARFIPACAGNAFPGSAGDAVRSVHPRVCGERVGLWRTPFPSAGSSPRVRGTPGAGRVVNTGRRFIPACAGNAGQSLTGETHTSVHPRVCGERSISRADFKHIGGSSPRVRGTQTGSDRKTAKARFIPACAGNAASGR